MKIQLRSVLKTPYTRCRWWQERQLLIHAGNTIAICPINKSPSDFIPLYIDNVKLFSFVASPNRKHIFTAQKIRNQSTNKKQQHPGFSIQICSYSVNGQRKAFRISQHSHYMPADVITSIELVTDEFQSSVVFVVTKSKSEVCVSLIDFLKLRLVASGFIGHFEHLKVCTLDTYEFSISGKGLMRRFKAQEGMWNAEQRLPKKLTNSNIVKHQWLEAGRIMMAIQTGFYIIDENQITQTFTITTPQDPIFQVLKSGNSLIFVTTHLKIYYFVQQNQQTNKFILEQQTSLQPEQQFSKITQIEWSKRGEQIIIVLDQQQYYHSKVIDLAVGSQQKHLHFQKIAIPCSKLTNSGDICTSSGQNFCLLSTQNSVEIWDLKTVKILNKLEINTVGGGNQLRRCSLNPDGHSFCIATSDRIKFYKILINKFKNYSQFPCRNCTLIQYSHGGQLIAFGSGRGTNSTLTIVNTLKSTQIHVFKLGFTPSQAIWNQYDDQIYVSGKQTPNVNVYKISSRSKQTTLNFDQIVSFMRHDYLTKRLLVSVGQKVAAIDSSYNITWQTPQIPNFHYVFPIQKHYLAADTEGNLHYSTSLQFEKYKSLSLFIKQKYNLQYRKETLIAFTTPSNSIIAKVKLPTQKKQTNTALQQQQEDIILVQKQQVNKLFDKVRLLENQLEQLQNLTSVKLQDERKKYNESLEQNCKNFQNEIDAIAKRMQELQVDQVKKDKQSQRVFDELEVGQIRSVNQLEKVYDIKIKLHKEKYLALQQEKMQQSMKFQKLIKQLQHKYHSDIQRVRDQYSKQMQKGVKFSQEEKNRGIQYKRKMEAKIIDLQQEQQITLFEMQISKDNQIKNLIQKNTKLERDYDSVMISLHNMQEDMAQLKEKYQQSLEKLKRNQRVVQQNIASVKVLEQEVAKKNEIIDSKNVTIEQQLHQIGGLQKAKYILGFRATQVRKQLEPKEGLIQKLKSQLFKLDEDFKKEMKKNFELSQKIQKIQKISIATRKQKNEIKLALQHKERIHDDMCLEMYMLINNVDPKQWNSKIIKIYQQYIKQDKFANRAQQKKSDNTSEEINRHLIHVQQSLHQVATGNEKMLKGKEMQVVRKMKENAQLVYDLNIMRKKQNQYIKQIQEKDTTISRLKRQIHEVTQGNKSTRVNTANTGFTRRVVSRDPNYSNHANNNDLIDLSIRRQSDYLIPDRQRKGRAFSAHKTVLWRQDSRKQKSKISDLAKQLQSAKNTIRRQDRMIQQLNQRLLGLPQDQLM